MAQEYTDAGAGDNDDFLIPQKKLKAKETKVSKTDCRTDEGITVGLIDSIISISRVLKQRFYVMKLTPAIEEALKDLRSDEDLKGILKNH